MKYAVNGRFYDVLVLPIKKEWFSLILRGEKKEEYRKICDYYRTRFYKHGMLASKGFDNLGKTPVTGTEKYILFRNGYSSSSPSFVAKCTLEVKEGNLEWGAEKGTKYYVLNILQIINNPCKEIFESQRIATDEDMNVYESIMQGLDEAIAYENSKHSAARSAEVTVALSPD